MCLIFPLCARIFVICLLSLYLLELEMVLLPNVEPIYIRKLLRYLVTNTSKHKIYPYLSCMSALGSCFLNFVVLGGMKIKVFYSTEEKLNIMWSSLSSDPEILSELPNMELSWFWWDLRGFRWFLTGSVSPVCSNPQWVDARWFSSAWTQICFV